MAIKLKAISMCALLVAASGSSMANDGGQFANLIVQGGPSQRQNAYDHEQEALVAYHLLFHKHATLFNAGDGLGHGWFGADQKRRCVGTSTPVVKVSADEEYLSTMSGNVVVDGSSLPKGTRPAQLSEVREGFEELASKDYRQVTLMFGGHGNPQGVELWGGVVLSGEQIREWQKQKLKDDTVVRQLHTHCYAGAAMVDSRRVPPQAAADWPEYLSRHYRKNTCALGFSRDDELTQAWGLEKPWDHTPWAAMLVGMHAKGSAVTLSRLRDELLTEEGFHSTPVLTSDYLIQDLIPFLCAMQGGLRGTRPPMGLLHHEDVLAPAHPVSEDSPCEPTRADRQWRKISSSIREETGIVNELGDLAFEIATEAMSQDEYESILHTAGLKRGDVLDYVKREERLEALRQKAATLFSARKWTELRDAEKEIHKLTESNTLVDLFLTGIAYGYGYFRNPIARAKAQAFRETFEEESFQDWLGKPEQRKRFSTLFSRWDKLSKIAGAGGTFSAAHRDAALELDRRQADRRRLASSFYRRNRAFVEQQLSRFAEKDPKVRLIRNFYLSVRRCEDSELR